MAVFFHTEIFLILAFLTQVFHFILQLSMKDLLREASQSTKNYTFENTLST